jgi:hypothetical protein
VPEAAGDEVAQAQQLQEALKAALNKLPALRYARAACSPHASCVRCKCHAVSPDRSGVRLCCYVLTRSQASSRTLNAPGACMTAPSSCATFSMVYLIVVLPQVKLE